MTRHVTRMTIGDAEHYSADERAAIVATLGAEAFDTLYITDANGEALSEEHAKNLAAQIERQMLTQ